MNLTTDAWIPIVWNDGKPGTVSLCEAFERGHEIQDLAVRPHERISLMRLLLCIAQAALNGPNDDEEWKDCCNRIVPAALRYLTQWQESFKLIGCGPRFLQVKGHGNLGTMELDKLDFVDADMTTVFDHDSRLGRQRDLAWIAFHLVVYQSFAAGGTVGGSMEQGGRLQPQKGKNGPCRDSSAFHAFVRRRNIISTLHSNMATKQMVCNLKGQSWGIPVWEAKANELTELLAIPNLSRSYLGRLVPISRAVWLNDDCATASNANGTAYPSYGDEGISEPSMSIRVAKDRKGQERRVLLSALEGDEIKKPWRELHALTVKQISNDGIGGPLALNNIGDDEEFDLWVGAMVTGQAKIRDTVESTYHVPKGMLHKTIQLAYEKGVSYAEDWERRLRNAIGIYRLAMETNEDTKKKLEAHLRRLRKPDRQRLAGIATKACSNYWTLIEHRLGLLNRFALRPMPSHDGKIQYHRTEWGMHVCSDARDSYEHACPHETPRQMRAYAWGLETLFPASAKDSMVEIEQDAVVETEQEAEA